MAQKNNTPGILSAFMPGQANAISSQLNQGFGGGRDKWRGMLSDAYGPMHNSVNFQYGGVDAKKDWKKKPDGKGSQQRPTDVKGTGGPMIPAGNQAQQMGAGAQQPVYRQMGQQGMDPETMALLNMWQRGR